MEVLMPDFRFLFYSDEGQLNTDWSDTLAVISYCAGKAPAQKQVMMDAYGKVRTVTEHGSKIRNAAAQAQTDPAAAEKVMKLTRRLVSFATEFALYGNIWQQWIAYMMMMHENPFTLTCERRPAGKTSTMMRLAERDFELFRELMHLDLETLGKATGTDLLAMMAKYHMHLKHLLL